MTRTLHAEWTKLRTLPSTAWLVLAIVVFTIAVSTAVAMTADVRHCATPTSCNEDIAKLSLTGARLGQVAVMVFAVLAMSNEYGTRLIQATLTATPTRGRVLLSKMIVVTGVTLAAGAAGVLGSLLVARNILPGNGFNVANGYPALSPADGPTLRAAAGTVLYLGLIAILSVGVATIVRDTAAGITAVVCLLFLSPMVSAFVTNPVWQHRLQRYSPMNAGLAIQNTRDLGLLHISPWAGLGVLAAYAAAAVIAGAVVLHARDA